MGISFTPAPKEIVRVDTGLQTAIGSENVMLIADQESEEILGTILDELRLIKKCLKKMSDLDLEED